MKPTLRAKREGAGSTALFRRGSRSRPTTGPAGKKKGLTLMVNITIVPKLRMQRVALRNAS
jgi:hypothetical protein